MSLFPSKNCLKVRASRHYLPIPTKEQLRLLFCSPAAGGIMILVDFRPASCFSIRQPVTACPVFRAVPDKHFV